MSESGEQRSDGTSPRRRRLKQTLAGVALLGSAWLLVPWGIDQWRQSQVQKEWDATQKRWEAQKAQDRALWLQANPGKLYEDSAITRKRIATLPRPVREAWADHVLLDDGTVLAADDLIRLRLDPLAPLPPAPSSPHLLSLYARHGAAVWSDGRVRIGDLRPAQGVGTIEIHSTRRERYDYEYYRPRPERGPLHALTDVVTATSGAPGDFVVILRRNGQVHVLGERNEHGQLGPQLIAPDGVPGFALGDATAVAVGERHALALKRDGSVWMWGQDDLPNAPLGKMPDETFQPTPRKVELSGRAVKVAAGWRSSFALLEDGSVWAWGRADCAALGLSPKNLPQDAFSGPGIIYLPDAPHRRNPMLKPHRVEGLTDVIDVQAAYDRAVALKRDGTVWAWGLTRQGEGGSAEYPLPKYEGRCDSDIEATVWAGFGRHVRLPHPMREVDNVKQIFAAPGTTAIVKNDNTLWFIGTGCKLCAGIDYEVLEYQMEEWGLVAAKAMWCGKVEEVTALRKAVDAMLQTRYPRVWGTGKQEVHAYREHLRGRLRDVAQWSYRIGYDEETKAMRTRAGNPKVGHLPPESDQSAVWFDAIDISLGGQGLGNAGRREWLTAFIRPDDERQFKGEHCPAVDAAVKAAMSEVAHEHSLAVQYWQAERSPWSPLRDGANARRR